MAYRMLNTGDGLYRQNNLVSSISDITILMRFTPRSNIAGGDYRTVFAYINGNPNTAYTKYFGIYGELTGGQQAYSVQVSDGTTTLKSTTSILTNFTTYNLAYIRKGNEHIFQLFGIEIGRVTLSLAGINWISACAGGDGFTGVGGSVTNEDIAYYREFNSALTTIEVINEFQSSSAYDTGIISDTPLISNGTDISGGGNTWSNIATIGTFVNNTLPGSPQVIPLAFPYNRVVTQAEFNVANLFWFKFTNPTNLFFGSFTNKGGTFIPRTTMYLSDANTIVDTFTDAAFYKTIGPGDYYFKIVRSAGGASNFDFTTTFDILASIIGVIPPDSIIVNDDAPEGAGGTVWNVSTGALLGIFDTVPAGELGATLPDGTSLWHDRFKNYRTTRLAILDPNLAYVASVDTVPPLGGGELCICANGTDFFVLNPTNNKIWKITKAGVVSDTGATLTGKFLSAMGVSRDGTIVYFVEGTTNPSLIQAWNITTNTSLGTIYTISPSPIAIGLTAVNGHNGEILILSDNSIVTYYYNAALTVWTIIQVTPAGVLVHTYDFTAPFNAIDHIAYTSSGTSIHVWWFKGSADDSQGKFGKLDLTTGTITASFTIDLFSVGQNQVNASNTIFGPSASCTMLTMPFLEPGTTPPPLTTMPPLSTLSPKHTDSASDSLELTIPTPQFKTALLGN